MCRLVGTALLPAHRARSESGSKLPHSIRGASGRFDCHRSPHGDDLSIGSKARQAIFSKNFQEKGLGPGPSHLCRAFLLARRETQNNNQEPAPRKGNPGKTQTRCQDRKRPDGRFLICCMILPAMILPFPPGFPG